MGMNVQLSSGTDRVSFLYTFGGAVHCRMSSVCRQQNFPVASGEAAAQPLRPHLKPCFTALRLRRRGTLFLGLSFLIWKVGLREGGWSRQHLSGSAETLGPSLLWWYCRCLVCLVRAGQLRGASWTASAGVSLGGPGTLPLWRVA